MISSSTTEPPVTNGDEALARLMRGNQRFVVASSTNANQSIERRAETAIGQMPFAVILGCSDSRVPLEIVFDQGLGDLFVIRLAGNVFDDHVGVASIEYAINLFHCPLLMVLGHDNCGGVTAALDAFEQNKTLPGKLDSIVQAIRPAIEQSQHQSGNRLDNAINANVLYVVEKLKHADPFISQAHADGKLKIVGARYKLKTGAVQMLSS